MENNNENQNNILNNTSNDGSSKASTFDNNDYVVNNYNKADTSNEIYGYNASPQDLEKNQMSNNEQKYNNKPTSDNPQNVSDGIMTVVYIFAFILSFFSGFMLLPIMLIILSFFSKNKGIKAIGKVFLPLGLIIVIAFGMCMFPALM